MKILIKLFTTDEQQCINKSINLFNTIIQCISMLKQSDKQHHKTKIHQLNIGLSKKLFGL